MFSSIAWIVSSSRIVVTKSMRKKLTQQVACKRQHVHSVPSLVDLRPNLSHSCSLLSGFDGTKGVKVTNRASTTLPPSSSHCHRFVTSPHYRYNSHLTASMSHSPRKCSSSFRPTVTPRLKSIAFYLSALVVDAAPNTPKISQYSSRTVRRT